MELIPKELRRAHEDGQVVFFCGAGVSKPAGFPSYWELVRDVLTDLLPAQDLCQPGSTESLAWKALNDDRYDEALEILESPLERGHEPKQVRERVRHHLTKKRAKLDKHLILCRLADLDAPQGRLVTTNFDDLFERAQQKLRRIEGTRHRLQKHIAPVLPPAKPQTSRGLTYLHGKLNHSEDDSGLVLTMSDFGVAYLLEGWARRFVVELFRHYHVVFIGYSVEDPTMRYLVSALAAAQAQFKHFKRAFAFAPFSTSDDENSNKSIREQEWKLKRLSVIAYDDHNGHEQLWNELAEWADDHRQGLAERRQTVARLGRFPPLTFNDPETSEMEWALSDPTVARYFANLEGNDRPDPKWIAPLQETGLLSLPSGETKDGQPISTPLVSYGLVDGAALNPSTGELGRWIARCLESPEALSWALSKGGVLHREFRMHVRWQLDNNAGGIPSALIRVWRVLSDDVYAHDLATHRLLSFGDPGVGLHDAELKRTLLSWLKPIPVFDHRRYVLDERAEPDPNLPGNWYRTDIALVGIDSDHQMQRFRESARDWSSLVALMAHDVTTQLLSALDWLELFSQASDQFDRTSIDYPSISPHDQNEHAPAWTHLIELAREGFDELMAVNDHAAASRLARRWQSLPYPIFRRLALYAATGGRDA